MIIKTSTHADIVKEYRTGEIAYINGRDYLIASNNAFAEILEFTPDNKLVQISEVHGMENVNDLCVSQERGRTYLFVLSGRYIYKYDISNPIIPKVEFRADLYQWNRGKISTGYMKKIACNNNYVFTAGPKGVRSFLKENLIVNKVYTYEPSYGLAADNNNLFALLENKSQIYDIKSGKLLEDYNTKNIDLYTREPAIDYNGNIYLISDNSIKKTNGGIVKEYFNPTSPGINFSYSASVLPTGEVYYVNGYGLTKLNSRLEKENFFHSAKPQVYGPSSWAVGVEAKEVAQGKRVVIFNKSSILLLDGNLDLLYQYIYSPIYSDEISTELKIVPGKYWGMPGESIELKLYGFWPNEEVDVTFGNNKYLVEVNNLGYREIELTVQEAEAGRIVIGAVGQSSKFRYQVSFEIR